MSIESAQAFIERMKTDEEFAKNVTECKDSEARMTYVKEAGFDFTPEEIMEQRGELSDEELDVVAGGGGWDWFVEAHTTRPNCGGDGW